ncbi:hypothetical protein [Aquibacillus sediminis]|uniref:hypothetical protein n=1 Tax=Aquibacillus sediminis TaxID=2574734 RepID=UPI001109460C|nr:hypothetical protein [Aquibacillus sediminis]
MSKEMKELFPIDEELLKKLPNSWRDKALKEGKKEATKNIAKEMLSEGLPIEMIARVTKLDRLEIEALEKEFKD